MIKHCEQSSLQKAHNARINDDLYHQRTMCETVFSMWKGDEGDKLRSRSWHGQFRELTESVSCITCRGRSADAAARSFSDRRSKRHRQRRISSFTNHSLV